MILEPFRALLRVTNGRTDLRTEDRMAQAGPPSCCGFSAREGAPPPHSNNMPWDQPEEMVFNGIPYNTLFLALALP